MREALEKITFCLIHFASAHQIHDLIDLRDIAALESSPNFIKNVRIDGHLSN